MDPKSRALQELKELEERRSTTDWRPEEERRHKQLVTELINDHAVGFICVETGEQCNPLDPPEGCTCRPQ
jgi:hypothetical protein